MKAILTDPENPMRRDLSHFFGGWLLAANFIWLTTPWLDALEPTWGAAGLWTVVIPGCSLAALYPRRSLGLALAAAALPLWTAYGLIRPCRFRFKPVA